MKVRRAIGVSLLGGAMAASAAAQPLTFVHLAGSHPGAIDGGGSAARFYFQ